jgi:Protein of unknown function (DUF3106)
MLDRIQSGKLGKWATLGIMVAAMCVAAPAQAGFGRHLAFAAPQRRGEAAGVGVGAGTGAGAGGSTPKSDFAGAGGAKPQGKGKADGRGMAGLPPKWVERLQEMSPEEQEKFMRNNAEFRHLPPERQAQVRNRLQHWNNLTPEQRAEFRTREFNFEHMSPQQREEIRNNLLPRWRDLPMDRRLTVREHLRSLQGLSAADRDARLNDPEFMRGLSPNEQGILRDLNGIQSPPPQ